jgi:phage terminase large subunit-like protein
VRTGCLTGWWLLAVRTDCLTGWWLLSVRTDCSTGRLSVRTGCSTGRQDVRKGCLTSRLLPGLTDCLPDLATRFRLKTSSTVRWLVHWAVRPQTVIPYVWYSVDCASWYICVTRTNQMQWIWLVLITQMLFLAWTEAQTARTVMTVIFGDMTTCSLVIKNASLLRRYLLPALYSCNIHIFSNG